MQEFPFELADAIVGLSPHPSGFTVVSKGSAKYCCTHCHGDAWISREGQQALKRRPEVKVYCLKCVREGNVRDKDGNCPRLGRPPREVIEATWGKEIADLIMKSDWDPSK